MKRRLVTVLVVVLLGVLAGPQVANAATPGPPPAECTLTPGTGAFTIHQGTVRGYVWIHTPGYTCTIKIAPQISTYVEQTARSWSSFVYPASGQPWMVIPPHTVNAIACQHGWRVRLHMVVWWGWTGIRSDLYSQNVPGFTSTVICP